MFFVNNVAGTPVVMAEWLDSYEGKPWVTPGMLAHAGHDLALQDPAKAADWIATLDGNPALENLNRPVERLLDAWIKKNDLNAPKEWLAGNRSHPLHDQIAVDYVQRLSETDPPAAEALLETISDENLRDRAARWMPNLVGE